MGSVSGVRADMATCDCCFLRATDLWPISACEVPCGIAILC